MQTEILGDLQQEFSSAPEKAEERSLANYFYSPNRF